MSIEWSIVRGVPHSPESGPSRLRELATQLVNADFKAVLCSPEAREVFEANPDIFNGPPRTDFPTLDSSTQLVYLITAVALLHSFVQINWTGPDLSFTLLDLFSTNQTLDDINAGSLSHLTLRGEPAYHLVSSPSLFLASLRLFDILAKQSSPLETLSWWLLRSHLVHQSLLDENVDISPETLSSVRNLLQIVSPDDLATLHLEIGLLENTLGHDKVANQEFLAAAQASGLEFELTGAMGKKTKFQVDAVSQLVLLAESKRSDTGLTINIAPETLKLNDDTLLEETEFTPDDSVRTSVGKLSHLDPAAQPPLHPLDQALLLSLCLAQHNNTPSSGLTASQMMPFLSRVISHPRNWSIHTTALLLRSRLEAARSRTVERSTLQLAALIEQMPTSDSKPAERLQYFHQLPLPSKWEMERELAKRYLTLGVVRSALDIFTRLEMWEDAVQCLQRMEREEEAKTIVQDLLAGRKFESDLVPALNKASEPRRAKLTAGREAKLWCVLGDLALGQDEESKKAAMDHYRKAWEVSEHTSSRAMRSLGSLYVSGGEYEQAVPCFQAALDINPLFARTWFTLGVCFVKLERWVEARDTFRREVAVEEDDAEGWNNLAAVYLRLDDGPSASYENKLAAWRALKQGLRNAHDSWRMWQNYMIVSVDVGELAEAARAMTRVVEELSKQDPHMAVDPDVLDKLVDSVTRDDWNGGTPPQAPTTSNEGFGLLPIVDRLFEVTVLPRISDSPRVWRSHARLQRWREDWQGAMDDYLRAYRVGVVGDEAVERDLGRWKEAVEEVEELIDILSVLGPAAAAQTGDAESGGNRKKGDWRFQARGIVRTFMGRTRDSFEDQPEYARLQEKLDELKKSI